MAVWRRHALRLFPELHDDIERDAATPYGLFFLLLPFVRDAHQRDDEDALRRAYGFAQWCHHQRHGSELPNAVGVAFYEHLFDDWSLRGQVAPWVSPHVARDIWPLWQDRLEAPKLAEIRRLLGHCTAPRWHQLRAVVPD
jgi:hypothetical protein